MPTCIIDNNTSWYLTPKGALYLKDQDKIYECNHHHITSLKDEVVYHLTIKYSNYDVYELIKEAHRAVGDS